MPSPAPAADPITPLVRLLFRGVYDDLPVNARYDIITEVPDDYALVYKRGHYVLSVHCEAYGLKLMHVPLNPDDACKALDSRAYLEGLVASVRTDPGAFYIWSIEGVHLMRLETDPEYKPLPKPGQPPPPMI